MSVRIAAWTNLSIIEFRDLDYLSGGQHEQIDYVYVSCFGIFVVTTPNHQGRIWGDDGNWDVDA